MHSGRPYTKTPLLERRGRGWADHVRFFVYQVLLRVVDGLEALMRWLVR